MAKRVKSQQETWELAFEAQPVNVELLHEEMAIELGDGFAGISTGRDELRVIFNRPLRKKEPERVQQVLDEHDPEKMSERQVREKYRQENLALFRGRYRNTTLDIKSYSDHTAKIQELVERVAWLEMEIRELRGDV